jgi:hypothetical protein
MIKRRVGGEHKPTDKRYTVFTLLTQETVIRRSE